MSPIHSSHLDTKNLAQRFADVLVELAAKDSPRPDRILAELDALRSADGFDVPWPEDFLHAFEKRLHALLGWYAYAACDGECCDDGSESAWAEDWLFKDGYPFDAHPAGANPAWLTVTCTICSAEFAYFDSEVCGSCHGDFDAARRYYDPTYERDRLARGIE